MSLSIKDQMTLRFERQWWKYGGAKEAAVRELFSESMTRYYMRLNVLIERPEAWAYDPMLVKRLRRLKEHRRRHREAIARTFEDDFLRT